MSPLVNPAALFKIRLRCPRRDVLWPPGKSGLDDACRLPSFADVAGVPDVLDLWTAWNPDGLAVRAVARGVGTSRWCHTTRRRDRSKNDERGAARAPESALLPTRSHDGEA